MQLRLSLSKFESHRQAQTTWTFDRSLAKPHTQEHKRSPRKQIFAAQRDLHLFFEKNVLHHSMTKK